MRSRAGHDCGTFFAVLSVAGRFAMICDGKERPLDRPKKKSLKHLCSTQIVFSEDDLTTIKHVRAALRPFGQPSA